MIQLRQKRLAWPRYAHRLDIILLPMHKKKNSNNLSCSKEMEVPSWMPSRALSCSKAKPMLKRVSCLKTCWIWCPLEIKKTSYFDLRRTTWRIRARSLSLTSQTTWWREAWCGKSAMNSTKFSLNSRNSRKRNKLLTKCTQARINKRKTMETPP